MRWSQLRHRVELSFAPEVRGRVSVHSTKYSSGRSGCQCGRGWITVDGVEVAGLNTAEAWFPQSPFYDRCPVAHDERTPGMLVEKGEFTRFDLHDACWALLHENVHTLLSDERPLVRTIAVLNERVGATRLKRMRPSEAHPLVLAMIDLRLQVAVSADAGV